MYTGLGDDELFVVVPGKDLEKVATALETIVSANKAIGEFAQGRRAIGNGLAIRCGAGSAWEPSPKMLRAPGETLA